MLKLNILSPQELKQFCQTILIFTTKNIYCISRHSSKENTYETLAAQTRL